MLILKPNCECCDRDLPPVSGEAMICSYECTFCKDCVNNLLHNVCPNCGGGFTLRPIRPVIAHRPGVSLQHQPASTQRVQTKYSREALAQFARTLSDVPANER